MNAVNYITENGFDRLEEKFLHPEKISERRSLKKTIMAISFYMIIIITNLIKTKVNSDGYSEIK